MKTKKIVALVVGLILVVMVVILGAVQIFRIGNIYGAPVNKWYFYSKLVISGIIGLVLAAWGLLKRGQKQTASPAVK